MANPVGRRAFLGNFALAVGGVAGAQVLLSACGGSSNNPPANTGPVNGGNCSANGSLTMTSGPSSAGDGHTHTFVMSAGEITAANASASFNTSSTFQHTHPVVLTAAEYASLTSNQGVATTTGAASDGDGHTHSLVINCA